MKERKALKRLHRVERLLGIVIDQFDAGTSELQGLLAEARSSVASATRTLAASPVGKPAVKAEQLQSRKLSNAARKRLSIAAKKRWAAAKRNGMTTLAKMPSRKIA
jgi:hypothetical protein